MNKASTKAPAKLKWEGVGKKDNTKALFIALLLVLAFAAVVIFAYFAWDQLIRPELMREVPELFAK